MLTRKGMNHHSRRGKETASDIEPFCFLSILLEKVDSNASVGSGPGLDMHP